MKFVVSAITVVALLSVSNVVVEASQRGLRQTSVNDERKHQKQNVRYLMMGGSMGGGSGGQKDGCDKFKDLDKIPYSLACSTNEDCVAMGYYCCVDYTANFCHSTTPEDCNDTLHCLQPGEWQEAPEYKYDMDAVTAEAAAASDFIEIMSATEDIKVYQNAAGSEVIEIAPRSSSTSTGASEAQSSGPVNHHSTAAEIRDAAAPQKHDQVQNNRPLMHAGDTVPQDFDETSGDGSSPDDARGDCESSEFSVYFYMDLYPEDKFWTTGSIKLVELDAGSKSSDDEEIWDEDFELPDKDGTEYVGEECLARTGCYEFTVEADNDDEDFEEGMMSFYIDGIERVTIDDDGVKTLPEDDSTTSFDEEQTWKFGLGCSDD